MPRNEPPSPRKLGRLIAFWLLYPVYLLAFLLAVHYVVFWRPFVHRMRNERKPDGMALETPRYITEEIARQLGSLQPDKQSSFVHFEESKAPGTVRVCAFGDSFTYGSEVDETHDYPAFLQKLFDRRGPAHVEVINFGNHWHGFHQAYILWDTVGRRFACDFVLLGPGNFFREREVTFNHTDLRYPYFLHARYVLDGEDVRLVPVLGASQRERFDQYFRFFPHWTYLRYDRNAPPVLRAALRGDRTLPNPFYYYDGSIDAEAFATYRILLRKLAASGAQILLLHPETAIVDIANQVGMPNLVAAQTHRVGFPYQASFGHHNAYGNQSIAEQFYARVTGEPAATLTVLRVDPVPFDEHVDGGHDAPPLFSYDEIDVRLDDAAVGFLVTPRWEPGAGTASSLKGRGVVALLAIKSPEASLVDACFVPLDFPLQANADVVWQASGPAPHVSSPLGRVRLLGAALNIGVADIEGIGCPGQWQLSFRGNRTVSLQDAAQAGTITIMVGDHAALKGSAGAGRVELLPTKGSLRRLRAGLATAADVDDLQASGEVNLVLHHRQYGTRQVRIGRWTKEQVAMPRAERVLQKPLSLTNGSRAAGQ